MTNRLTQAPLGGGTLLVWCGYAALAGLFAGVAVGVVALLR